VCPSVRLSVTIRYYIKMPAHTELVFGIQVPLDLSYTVRFKKIRVRPNSEMDFKNLLTARSSSPSVINK